MREQPGVPRGPILHVQRVATNQYVYVLESLTNPSRHDTGISSDVPGRLSWHNAGLSPHSAKHRPWKLLVSIEFTDIDYAVRFEKYLKSGSGRAFAKRHFG